MGGGREEGRSERQQVCRAHHLGQTRRLPLQAARANGEQMSASGSYRSSTLDRMHAPRASAAQPPTRARSLGHRTEVPTDAMAIKAGSANKPKLTSSSQPRIASRQRADLRADLEELENEKAGVGDAQSALRGRKQSPKALTVRPAWSVPSARRRCRVLILLSIRVIAIIICTYRLLIKRDQSWLGVAREHQAAAGICGQGRVPAMCLKCGAPQILCQSRQGIRPRDNMPEASLKKGQAQRGRG